MCAQITPFGVASAVTSATGFAEHNGGSARGYQARFRAVDYVAVPVTAPVGQSATPYVYASLRLG